MKKQRKPRTKKQRHDLEEKKCHLYDGPGIYECFYPWNIKCKGERHKCFKLKLQWLASLPDDKRKLMQEKYN